VTPAAPEPCDWADDAELDRQLAEADADAQAFVDLHGRSYARPHIPDHRPVNDVLETL
jgi:hypothetical protein